MKKHGRVAAALRAVDTKGDGFGGGTGSGGSSHVNQEVKEEMKEEVHAKEEPLEDVRAKEEPLKDEDLVEGGEVEPQEDSGPIIALEEENLHFAALPSGASSSPSSEFYTAFPSGASSAGTVSGCIVHVLSAAAIDTMTEDEAATGPGSRVEPPDLPAAGPRWRR